jgi:hypothetical protein
MFEPFPKKRLARTTTTGSLSVVGGPELARSAQVQFVLEDNGAIGFPAVSMRSCMRLNMDGTIPTGVTTFIVTGSQPLLGKLNEEVPRAFSYCKG